MTRVRAIIFVVEKLQVLHILSECFLALVMQNEMSMRPVIRGLEL